MPIEAHTLYFEFLTYNCDFDKMYVVDTLIDRVPKSPGNHGKPEKSLKKSSIHGKIMEFL